MIKLVVWLGNPGKEYNYTRHNIWFWAVDWIADYYGFTKFLFNKKFNAELSTGKIGKWAIVLAKPQTFMNLSWDSVSKLINFYKIDFKDILVIHDDIDLPFWKIKLKRNWSSGGHNWIKDIVKKIWTDKFWRLKLGIWRPNKKEEVVNYVLSRFKKDEFNYREQNKKLIFEKVEEWLKNSG